MQAQPDSDIFKQDEPSAAVALVPAIIGGLVGALIGGAIWAAIAVITDYEVGYVALGVGALAGFGVLIASGRKRGAMFQIIAVITGVIGIFIGKYLSLFFIFRKLLVEQGGEAIAASFGITSPEMFDLFGGYLRTGLEALDIFFIVLAVLAAWGIPSARRAQPKPSVSPQ